MGYEKNRPVELSWIAVEMLTETNRSHVDPRRCGWKFLGKVVDLGTRLSIATQQQKLPELE